MISGNLASPSPLTRAHARGRSGHRQSYSEQDDRGPGGFAGVYTEPPLFHFRADEDNGNSTTGPNAAMFPLPPPTTRNPVGRSHSPQRSTNLSSVNVPAAAPPSLLSVSIPESASPNTDAFLRDSSPTAQSPSLSPPGPGGSHDPAVADALRIGTASPTPLQVHFHSKDAYPLPSARESPLNPRSAQEGGKGVEWRYELHAPGVPRQKEQDTMVLLEKVWLEGGGHQESSPPSTSQVSENGPEALAGGELCLRGTVVVRNVMLEKHVFVRFTLDEWATTSEVCAHFVELVTPSTSSPALGLGEKESWDPFAFSIELTGYANSRAQVGERLLALGNGGVGTGLAGQELMMAVRFPAPDSFMEPAINPQNHESRNWAMGSGESRNWWDNNKDQDYRVGFKVKRLASSAPGERKAEEHSTSYEPDDTNINASELVLANEQTLAMLNHFNKVQANR
ncbi:hypothetical protein B0H13DRAFT_2306912 [Mycena leptocephala]|nr:hypothetical protein B0H13DRAFT_2306912 [Mycena leptocephala]